MNEVWVVSTLCDKQGIGLVGVFTTKDKAVTAARDEMKTIESISPTPLTGPWEQMETSRGGTVFFNGCWDLTIGRVELDTVQVFEGGEKHY